MSRWKPRFGRLSRRDQIQANNATFRFAAAATGDPEVIARTERELITPLPPKRERIRRPVDGKPVQASEHQEQCAVISWWWRVHQKYGLPTFALFAVPNGGARDVITGARLKAEGVRRGALDLILAKPTTQFAGLFLEMKVGSNKPSPEQNAFMQYLEEVGYQTGVHWNAGAAIKAIEDYLRDDPILPP